LTFDIVTTCGLKRLFSGLLEVVDITFRGSLEELRQVDPVAGVAHHAPWHQWAWNPPGLRASQALQARQTLDIATARCWTAIPKPPRPIFLVT
jgi:hypothetical protein